MSATRQEVWRLNLQPSGTIEPDLIDIRTVEAFNRYASHFVATIDDPDGDKKSDYPRGQRALAQYSDDGGSTWNTKQAGFVQVPRDTENGASIEVLFIGYDHFLRRRPVFDTHSSVTVSSALQTIIEEHTPVNWDAANVTVANDATVSREIKGERADELISWLATVSGDEEYGVNDDFEFFFRPRETQTAPSDILEGDWYDYDLPVEGRHAVNFVRVFYGDGVAATRSSVIVEDRAAQRDLKESLDAPRRVVLGASVHRPEIDNEDAAHELAKVILQNRSPALTGTVHTFEKFDWTPGDVFRLEIDEKGIDTTYRAAEIQHQWGRGTRVRVAQNTGNINDLLTQMSDDVVRIDHRDSDPDAAFTQFLEMSFGVTVSITAEISQTVIADTEFVAGFTSLGDVAGFTLTEGGEPQPGLPASGGTSSAGTAAATNAALNQFRDAWQGDSANVEDITEFAIGTGTSPVLQTDTSLDTQSGTNQSVDTVAASGSFAISFEGSIAAGGSFEGVDISEFGFFDASGDMHNRATVDTPVTHQATTSTSFTITFTVDNDAEKTGTVTNTGQTRLRDLYLDEAGTSGHEPTDRAYGSDDGTTLAEAESNTALGNKQGEITISEFADRSVGSTTSIMRIPDGTYAGDVGELGDENAANELLTRTAFEVVDMGAATAFDLESNFVVTARAVIV